MRRRRRWIIAAIGLGILLFLFIATLLTRALNVGDAEDAAVTSLVQAEARGDTAEAISLITGCRASAACRARAATNVAALRHPGAVTIAEMNPSSTFSVTSTLGTARVAWVAGDSLPRVQCLRVRHAGSVLQGFTIQLLVVSRRIASGADCPKRF
ncbi:MAG TPA: hypothetical protein VMF14_11050 [Solirubrobacteraceae bacterium]|nr:hypothetical protein [Solirubrobacteraceae bacterium]